MSYIEFYGIPFLIIGTGIFVIIKADSPKIKAKNLSFVLICLGINILVIPVDLFTYVMAAISPYSTELDFWKGFLFIQGIPLLILLLALIWWFIRKGKEKIDT
ncbi:hypothetical protein CN568_14610 [Bacillus pseudomycoides]|uniref:Uncharacterized protein n=1 Tax=Bacillus pseudomycoides TaxID=64104 RepID=A0ABD6T7G7_9BACI|nr:hypothetical protein [Bacillus pseudomycoides]PEK68658.1 hypothetical protein CN593_11090 [Bacillus pseudomycoides]PEP40469.1 hypothetical protein CN565_18320 [Bacillus pseudomycoides]PEP43130.1 hypothetical protein CN568_14610 [Bacillus pseudomycoides]PEP86894.1 hypothetical protein CN584_05620 [Bacillus pseudomycoides]PFX48710.1 hypothetical protein COL31_21750 [Bacillus pseudomycoides]